MAWTRTKGLAKLTAGIAVAAHFMPIQAIATTACLAETCIASAAFIASAGYKMASKSPWATQDAQEDRKNKAKQSFKFGETRLISAASTLCAPAVYTAATIVDGTINFTTGEDPQYQINGKNARLLEHVNEFYKKNNTIGKIVDLPASIIKDYFYPKQAAENKRLLAQKSLEKEQEEENKKRVSYRTPTLENTNYSKDAVKQHNFEQASSLFHKNNEKANSFIASAKKHLDNGDKVIIYKDPNDPKNIDKNVAYTIDKDGKIKDITAGKDANCIIPPIEDGNGGFVALSFKNGVVHHDNMNFSHSFTINAEKPSFSMGKESSQTLPNLMRIHGLSR